MTALRPEAPTAPVLTDYDWAHIKLYLRLIDAERAGATPAEVIPVLFGTDLEPTSPEAVRQHRSHLDRAHWLVAGGYPGKAVQLLHLFWEPPNAWEFPVFAEHRSEIERFAGRIRGSTPTFAAMSYAELWNSWATADAPAWLLQHVARLRARYDLPI